MRVASRQRMSATDVWTAQMLTSAQSALLSALFLAQAAIPAITTSSSSGTLLLLLLFTMQGFQ